jgi:carbon storage regulator
MLVLSRKIGERVVIGRNVTITVVAVRGERVRLAFDAPTEVPIHREEVFRRLGHLAADTLSPSRPDESVYLPECA